MLAFSELNNILVEYVDAKQIAEIERAYHLADHAHKSQLRSSGEPYITHPIAVAKILAEKRLDKSTIMAAILHDVIEDTDTSKDDIIKQFGSEVAELVDGVSKLAHIQFETRAEAQAESFRKMIMAMTRDFRVILIKLADRLHNMRTLGHLSFSKRQRIACETLEIYAPIANRLGMRAFRDELQDLSFKCLHPFRYRCLENGLKRSHGDRQEMLNKIQASLEAALQKAGIEHFSLHGRTKSLYSIYQKMTTKRLKFSEIMDVYGFRIVVPTVDLCYRVLGAVHGAYKPVPERFKDYIAIPKVNGYQSLHTTLFGFKGLPIEIQIRTKEMDDMARNGIAAHWLYKLEDEPNQLHHSQLRVREWIKSILDLQESTGSSLEFIENIKLDLFPDEVYVFTPKGMILELPKGATAVDFAYAIHSDLGNSCIAVKIDHRLAPLSSLLRNGQVLEVITALGASPNPAWLNFVVTAKARSNIRHYLKHQKRQEALRLGRELLASALQPYEQTIEAMSQEILHTVLTHLGYNNDAELFEAIGLGNQMAPIIAQRLCDHDDRVVLEESHVKSEGLVIKGTEGMVVTFASCCYPIPGDSVMGSLTAGRGVVIHQDGCPNMVDLRHKHPEKAIPVRWEDKVHGQFYVALVVQVQNQRGVLALLGKAVAQAESDIEDVHIDFGDGRYASIRFLLQVQGRRHLARIIRKLRQLAPVIRVHRTRMQK